ncbi:glycosyltransferase [Georgenia sp. MJ206]|uniref:glycosyltransferase n=1 Tax=Georgenia wangjunii TaxID=3117730 RepID=UPI002F261272
MNGGIMQIVVFSRGLFSLDMGACVTSSQIFELGLARALAAHADVTVVSVGAVGRVVDEGVTLLPLAHARTLAAGVNKALLGHAPLGSGKTFFIMFGYDPRTVAELKLLSMFYGAALVNYVFDTHVGATQHMPPLRRLAVNSYFRLGLRTLGVSNALLLLNELASQQISSGRAPALVSRVGSPYGVPALPPPRPPRTPFRVTYAGSLETYNGIEPLLLAFQELPHRDIVLDVLGDGYLTGAVADAARADARIRYHGRVGKAETDAVVARSHLLVALRDLNHPVAQYSFPSKVVDYLASGIPVLTTPIVAKPDFASAVNLVQSLDPHVIAGAIVDARAQPQAQDRKAALGLAYARKHHLWPDIAREIILFFDSL